MLWTDSFTPLVTQLRAAAFMPAADLTVNDQDLVLTMDVPGLAPEDLSIELQDGYLTVRGERKRPQVGEGASYVHAERLFGPFERAIGVPGDVDPDRIAAGMEHGVLSVIVPKSEPLRPTTVPIESGSEQRELETATA